ncbi:MAG: PDC sensor domain-containing protein, partial [Chloroflexota bacterium]|nr:PDC sensor domain-containing protein [Chloroflexota bacterium]
MSTTALAGTDAAEDLGAGRVSLRVRLVTGAVLLVLLTVGVTGTVSWFIADQKLVQTASDRLHDAAKTFAFLYEQRIEAAHSVGQQVAEEVALAVQQHELDAAAATEDKVPIEQQRAAITLILEPIRDLHPHYSLAVTDINGRVVARSAPEGARLPNTTLYHLPGVPHALQGESPRPAIVYQTDGRDTTCALAMSVATPIVGVEQGLLGVVYVAY